MLTQHLTQQEIKTLLKQLGKERVEDLPPTLPETAKVDFNDQILKELDRNGEIIAIWF